MVFFGLDVDLGSLHLVADRLLRPADGGGGVGVDAAAVVAARIAGAKSVETTLQR
jgi:hypothetical protein